VPPVLLRPAIFLDRDGVLNVNRADYVKSVAEVAFIPGALAAVAQATRAGWPLVVITSNNEKELPDAFLRRCVFHFIEFPDPELMKRIVAVHHPHLKEQLLDQVLVSAADPITASSIQELLGLADDAAVDGFISALTEPDVLAGVQILDDLEAEGRDLFAFSEQLVDRLRTLLVERMSSRSADERAAAQPLAQAARRLSGLDASRSGLGGYRWQLELCLLAAAEGGLRQRRPTHHGRRQVRREGRPARESARRHSDPERGVPQRHRHRPGDGHHRPA